MEEEKKAKKNNLPLIIMAVAVLLIIGGVVLIFTGNSKSLVSNDKKNNNTEEKTDTDDSKRAMDPSKITIEDITEMLNEAKAKSEDGETWTIGSVSILAHGNNNAILIAYDKVDSEGFVTVVNTIITFPEGKASFVEFPGWTEEKDLSEYEFISDEEDLEPNIEEDENIDEDLNNLPPEGNATPGEDVVDPNVVDEPEEQSVVDPQEPSGE